MFQFLTPKRFGLANWNLDGEFVGKNWRHSSHCHVFEFICKLIRCPKMLLADEGKFKLIFSLTGHNFSVHSTSFKRQIHLGFIFFILTIGIYQSIWFLYNNVLRCGINLFMFRFMIWTSKGIIIQCILLHLQFSGQLQKLANILFHQNRVQKGRKIYCFLGFSLAIYFFLMATGLVYFLLRICKIVDAGYHFKYGSLSAIFIRNFMWWITMWIVTSALVFYNFCVKTVVKDAEEFCNEIELMGKENDTMMKKSLVDFHKRHICIMKEVDCLEGTFKIYLFFMIGLNIPITISTLLRLLKSPMVGPVQYLFIVPENIFCWFELIALTALAAKLNILLRKIPKIFYMNIRMDAILDGQNKLLDSNGALFFHSITNLGGTLGLTLWEFTTITKPLIMTVVSLVASYLIVIYQVIPMDLEEYQFTMKDHLNLTILC